MIPQPHTGPIRGSAVRLVRAIWNRRYFQSIMMVTVWKNWRVLNPLLNLCFYISGLIKMYHSRGVVAITSKNVLDSYARWKCLAKCFKNCHFFWNKKNPNVVFFSFLSTLDSMSILLPNLSWYLIFINIVKKINNHMNYAFIFSVKSFSRKFSWNFVSRKNFIALQFDHCVNTKETLLAGGVLLLLLLRVMGHILGAVCAVCNHLLSS